MSLELPGLTLPQHEPVVRAAEAAGYTDAWSGETGGHDGFTSLTLAATWTERMRLGTGGITTPVVMPIPLAAPGTPVSPETYVELVSSLAPRAG